MATPTHPQAFDYPFVRAFAAGRFSAVAGYQIISVAVGWQLYERTGQAWALGLVGLFEVAPVLLLMVAAGSAADRYPRRLVGMLAHGVLALAAAGLALVTWANAPVPLVYALVVLVGMGRAFAAPAVNTILPQLLPATVFASVNAWVASSTQLAAILGPAAGGAIIAVTGSSTAAFAVAAAAEAVFVILLLTRVPKAPASGPSAVRGGVLAGLSFVSRSPVFLAAITLDLFAVLFGGAVALLPIFAKDILQVGPAGLGWLRAAPAAGALLMALVTTRLPPWERPGRVLLIAVAGFGMAMVGFGLSRHVGALAGLPVHHRHLRQRQRRHPPDAGADDHARRPARAGLGGEAPVRQHVERNRRVRERRHRRPVRSDRLGGRRRPPHDRRRRPGDLGVAGAGSPRPPSHAAADGTQSGTVSIARSIILKASDSIWLREHGTKAPFVRRAVARFMPGETFDDMLGAARAMTELGVAGVFTRLGENVKDRAEADEVAAHYLDGIARVRALGLSCEPSIKLTQLGLDIDREFAYAHALRLAQAAHEAGSYFWVDMEQSSYVDVTLDIVRRLREAVPSVGVCLQAYLMRTGEDLHDITGRGIGVRLVKGAYKEPLNVAYPVKADVDENYYALAQSMLGAESRAAGARAVFGTHDVALIARIRRHAAEAGIPPSQVPVPHAVRHPARRTAAPGARRRGGPRPHRLWLVLVPLVHAAPGRTAGERVVRGEEPLRLGAAADLRDLRVALIMDPLQIAAVIRLERGARFRIPCRGQRRLEHDVLLRELGLRGLPHFGDARFLLVGQGLFGRPAVRVLLAQARHGDLQRGFRCVVVVFHSADHMIGGWMKVKSSD